MVAANYAHSSMGKPHTPLSFQQDLEDFGVDSFEAAFKENYILARNSFVLPGLGEEGDDCMAMREKNGEEVPDYSLTGISEDAETLKFEHLKCKRTECPNCWTDWARERVFNMVLKIEAYARANDVRPYFAVASVDPERVQDEEWTWNNLQNRLIRRFYRRAESCGVDGGYRLLHPYRIKRKKGFSYCKNRNCSECPFKNSCVKSRLINDGWGSGFRDAGYWKGIRQDALDLGSWEDYVSFEPHLHSIVFADSPTKNESEDFFLSFKDDKYGNPEPMSLERVIGYAFYLITHVGVAKEFKTQPTQSFGVLNGFDPKEALGKVKYDELARLIAEKIGMNWDSEDEELVYAFGSEKEWFSVWELKDRLEYKEYEDWREGVSEEKLDFLEELQKFMGVSHSEAKMSDFGVSLPSLKDLEGMGFEIIEPEPPPDIEELAKGGD